MEQERRCSISSSTCPLAAIKASQTDRGDGERRERKKNDDDSDGAGEEPKDTSAGQPAGRSA